MERRIRLVLVGLMVCAFTTGLLILPVAAEVLRPPDYTVEYYDQIIRDKGYWYEPENVALEGGGIGGYLLLIKFQFNNVPQDGDVYKVRIDYDDSDPPVPENLYVHYRWNTGGPWGYITTCCATRFDIQFTISDPTSTTLQVRFMDSGGWFDFIRDQWEFGREPELWIYWL